MSSPTHLLLGCLLLPQLVIAHEIQRSPLHPCLLLLLWLLLLLLLRLLLLWSTSTFSSASTPSRPLHTINPTYTLHTTGPAPLLSTADPLLRTSTSLLRTPTHAPIPCRSRLLLLLLLTQLLLLLLQRSCTRPGAWSGRTRHTCAHTFGCVRGLKWS